MVDILAKSHRHRMDSEVGRGPFEKKTEMKNQFRRWVQGETRSVKTTGEAMSLDYMLSLSTVLILLFAGVIHYMSKTDKSTLPMSMGH